MIASLTALHLLRPHWLWALLALPPLLWWWRRRKRQNSVWRELVDPHLLPHLLGTSRDVRGWFGMAMATLAYALAVLALSGPSWRQSEQPLWQSRTPLVIALDLSSATLASDLPPSRLAQARAKLAMLLRERQGGQVALVAYADDAYTVAPLTDDAANVALFLDALQPDVMPIDGQRGDRAIAWSAKLLKQAGFQRGDILLLTDHADATARDAATHARSDGYRVSALGLGSEAGAVYRRDEGIVNARLDRASLRKLAGSGGGEYADLSADDRDLRALGVLDPVDTDATGTRKGGERSWRDEGYWLLLPLMLLALWGFRRRSGAFAAVLLCAWLPWQSAHAADLWRRADQRQHAQLEQGSVAYRRGDFADAAKRYGGIDTADGHYNRGNAFAKQQQYQEAIGEYGRALQLQPNMPDALANKRAVEAAVKRQHSGQGKQQQKSGSQQQQQQQGKPSPQDAQGAGHKPDEAKGQQSQADEKPAQQKPQPAPGAQATPTPQAQPKELYNSEAGQPGDAKGQQAADAAQRTRMQRALEQARKPSGQRSVAKTPAKETPEQRERRIANEAWLRRVPDEPGALLRNKFRLEYERRRQTRGEN